MSDERSARLALPYLEPGQAQKETFHNEALAWLDLTVQAAVTAVGIDTPPTSPATGDCWIVGAAPVGAWSGQAGALAGWTAGGWRFVAPTEGMIVWSIADAMSVRHLGGTWATGMLSAHRLSIDGVQVVAARQPAVAAPGGGATIDAEARAAIASVLIALRNHGLIDP